jgi:hypothetical protein
MRLTEIAGAKKLLQQSRVAIAEVAYQGAVKYQDTTPPDRRNRGHFLPNPRIAPYTIAHTADFEKPVYDAHHLESYPTIRVTQTSSSMIDHPWREPSVTHNISVVFRLEEGKNSGGLDSHAQINTNGDAKTFLPVNGIPQRRRKGATHDERLMDLRERTASGLLIARFAAATLKDVYGISVSTKPLDVVEERLTRSMPLAEITLQPGVEALIPQGHELINR